MAHHSPAKKFFQIEVLRHCIVDFVDPCTEASFSRVFCHQVRCWRWRETRPFSEQWNSFYLLSNHRKRYASFCRVLSDSWSCPDVQRVFKTHTWTCRGLYIEKTTFQVIFSPFLQRGQIPSIPAMQGDGKQFLLPMFGTERKDDKNNWDMCPNRYDASLSRLLAIRSLEDTGIHYNFLIKDLGYFSDHVRSEAPRKSQRELDLEECLWRHGDKSILESFVNKNKSRDEILQTETLPLEMRIFHGLPLEKLLDPIEKALERWCDNALREKILDHCLCTMPLTVFQATISWLMPDLWFDELKWLENFFSARSLRHPYENVILRFTHKLVSTLDHFLENKCPVQPLLSQISSLQDAFLVARALPQMNKEEIVQWLRMLLNQVTMCCSLREFMTKRSESEVATIYGLDIKAAETTRQITEDISDDGSNREAWLLKAILEQDEIGCYAILGSVMR